MTMGERIKKVRQGKHLTQQSLAEKIGTTQNSVARYEMGKIAPSNAVISLICREFHVNEVWLRTGEGEMSDKSDDSLLSQIADEYGLDAGQQAMVGNFLTLPNEYRTAIVGLVKHLANGAAPAEDAAKPPAPAEASARFTEEELAAYEKVKAAMEKEAEARGEKPASIDEKVEAYRKELEAVEKAKGRSSASPDTGEESA